MALVWVPVFLLVLCAVVLSLGIVAAGQVLAPRRSSPAKQMPYESGMDPRHDARRRFAVRFHALAIAFLVFDVELLFLYPWAVANKHPEGIAQVAQAAAPIAQVRGTVIFGEIVVFVLLLAAGLVYVWRRGVFRWR